MGTGRGPAPPQPPRQPQVTAQGKDGRGLGPAAGPSAQPCQAPSAPRKGVTNREGRGQQVVLALAAGFQGRK